MSTILKALKRLEAEREVQPPRPLREEVVAALEAAEMGRLRRGRRWRVVAAVSGAALGTGVLAWIALPWAGRTLERAVGESVSGKRMTVAAPPTASRPEARAAALPAPAASSAIATEASPSSVDAAAEPPLGSDPASGLGSDASLPSHEPPGAAGLPLVAVVPRPPPTPALQRDEATPAAPAGPLPGSVPPAPKHIASPPAEPAAELPSESPPEAERPAAAAPEQPATKPARPARTAAPRRERPPSTRVQVANPRDVEVLSTVWHPHPERRSAVVLLPGADAAQELREGETAQGWTLLEIGPSSVVLLHDGVEQRAAVGGRER